MAKQQDVSEEARHFIFEYIDSIEQLEILLFLWNRKECAFTIHDITVEFRSSENSVSNRLKSLVQTQLILQAPEEKYIFNTANAVAVAAVEGLDEVYRVKKQRVFELIFSPLKKARHFADAFVVIPGSKKEGK